MQIKLLMYNPDRYWRYTVVWPGEEKSTMQRVAADLPANRVRFFSLKHTTNKGNKERIDREIAILNAEVPDGY